MNIKIINLETVDSTNEFLKRENFSPVTVVTAKNQTNGKGRRGKKWISPKNRGLYISFLFRKPDNFENLQLLSLSTAVGVAKVLNRLRSGFTIKWPNDILINGRKICGILPEATRDKIIIGIGINLYHTAEELAGADIPATSLSIEKIKADRKVITEMVTDNVISYYQKTVSGEFNIAEFENLSLIQKGDEITIKTEKEKFTAKVLGFDREGFLIAEKDGEIKRLFAGEVSVRF
ncbi:biotin--[acetyl-CoA-carboxylase] ligase [Desulfurobacterium atlanticum]|uniref:biotin--[biotin carboxyl-carrier protein] ligase n=1 Tax=Desulfurobacterium atlanticum TaxID=240169 RepID=A0A238XLC7_9BACT|nr:biotin--[acetyl-CoA-carboxylase] ligase [Desulfurobacterium atlanticum]SNR59795.1 BirA family transcriptional regulator, biotin operon repressor / biotin-[acetyl-CoA-carboxylase] ligase [Desulfurobacterium atlanticum]